MMLKWPADSLRGKEGDSAVELPGGHFGAEWVDCAVVDTETATEPTKP